MSDGSSKKINSHALDLTAKRHWQAPNGSRYPLEWQLKSPGSDEQWIIKPVLDKQWMDTSVQYWEGAVDILDANSKAPVGRGYMELTGY